MPGGRNYPHLAVLAVADIYAERTGQGLGPISISHIVKRAHLHAKTLGYRLGGQHVRCLTEGLHQMEDSNLIFFTNDPDVMGERTELKNSVQPTDGPGREMFDKLASLDDRNLDQGHDVNGDTPRPTKRDQLRRVQGSQIECLKESVVLEPQNKVQIHRKKRIAEARESRRFRSNTPDSFGAGSAPTVPNTPGPIENETPAFNPDPSSLRNTPATPPRNALRNSRSGLFTPPRDNAAEVEDPPMNVDVPTHPTCSTLGPSTPRRPAPADAYATPQSQLRKGDSSSRGVQNVPATPSPTSEASPSSISAIERATGWALGVVIPLSNALGLTWQRPAQVEEQVRDMLVKFNGLLIENRQLGGSYGGDGFGEQFTQAMTRLVNDAHNAGADKWKKLCAHWKSEAEGLAVGVNEMVAENAARLIAMTKKATQLNPPPEDLDE